MSVACQSVTLPSLLDEVSASVYALRQKLSVSQLQKTWNALSAFILTSLIKRKGVLVPSLGTFYVIEKTNEIYQPAFELLDCRFARVSQEISHIDRRAKRNGIVNISYQRVGQEANLHRTTCQGVVRSITERLAMHILARHNLYVSFPKIGALRRNRAGRVEFKFDAEFIKELNNKQRQDYVLRSRLSSTQSTDRGRTLATRTAIPVSADERANNAATGELKQENCDIDGIECDALRCQESQVSAAMVCDEFDAMWKQCKTADKKQSGLVLKADAERWLQTHCRRCLLQIDALSLLDLLQKHTSDKSGRWLFYPRFLTSLKELTNRGDCQIMRIDREEEDGSEIGDEKGDPPTGTPFETPHLEQHRADSRRDCDAFSEIGLQRSTAPKGREIQPKVGEEQVINSDDPRYREPLPQRRIHTAPQQSDQRINDPTRSNNVLNLSETWRRQLEEKAQIVAEFRSSEGKWPYCPTHQPHVRIPATAPRYIHAHYVRPYNAPTITANSFMTTGCSFWSGL